MNIQDAVVLVLSNDNLNFSQIKEAYDALKNTNYAELTKLRVMARNKLNELQNDGKSLEINELLAASDLLDTISSNDEKWASLICAIRKLLFAAVQTCEPIAQAISIVKTKLTNFDKKLSLFFRCFL